MTKGNFCLLDCDIGRWLGGWLGVGRMPRGARRDTADHDGGNDKGYMIKT